MIGSNLERLEQTNFSLDTPNEAQIVALVQPVIPLLPLFMLRCFQLFSNNTSVREVQNGPECWVEWTANALGVWDEPWDYTL